MTTKLFDLRVWYIILHMLWSSLVKDTNYSIQLQNITKTIKLCSQKCFIISQICEFK